MMRLALTVIAIGILVSACSSTPPKPAEVAAAPASKAAPSPPPSAGVAPVAAQPKVTVETDAQKRDRIAKALAAHSIFFDYDDFSINAKYQDVLKQDVDLLRSAPQMSLRLVGSADERGSSEYNLALGQKRAEAVRRALTLHGIAESRLEAVSYGKEKPRGLCHEEKCWAENRRVDMSGK